MIREWDRLHPEKRRQIQRKYRASDKGKVQSAKERSRYQKQVITRLLVNNMRRYHDIQESCAICGDANTEAHHENYDEPFILIWLCKKHHLKGDVE